MSELEKLSRKTCEPCKRDVPPLQGDDLRGLTERLGNGWQVIDGHHLWKKYAFKNFRQALAFTNRIGEIAEEQGHHPDIELGWGRVGVKIFTHNIDGLSESDFVLAAKFEACAGE